MHHSIMPALLFASNWSFIHDRVWDPEDGKQLDCFDTAVHLEQSCSSMQVKPGTLPSLLDLLKAEYISIPSAK